MAGHPPAKRRFPGGKMSNKKKQKRQESRRSEGSHEEVLQADIRALLAQNKAANAGNEETEPHHVGKEDSKPNPPDPFTEIEVEIASLSSTGDGLGHSTSHENTDHIYVVPFTLPKETVRAKVIRHILDTPSAPYTQTDLLEILTPAPSRDDSLIKCKYFARCGGCHFQMLPYEFQLAHKKTVVEKAYHNFSSIHPAVVPEVGDTIGSPLQYGYRTKLTPHFDGPAGARSASRKGLAVGFKEVPPIGFMRKGTRWTLDVEECPIGTAALQLGLRRERKKVADQLETYKRGATILLRESTMERETKEKQAELGLAGDGRSNAFVDKENQTVQEPSLQDPDITLTKSCISDNNATSTEYVGDFVFKNPANAFFQNNNSILPIFTSYIRDHILPKDKSEGSKITNLIDAYCGSGLFTITLSSLFKRSVGIDISTESINFARTNAALNNLTLASLPPSPRRNGTEEEPRPKGSPQSPTKLSTTTAAPAADTANSTVHFTAGTASNIFASASSFNPLETAIVIDPPRKGCDEDFLRQLVSFKPARIVYVSCNVHTQARDVGWILQGGAGIDNDNGAAEKSGEDEQSKSDYEIESLRGFDFFPQTSHVESVAVLRRRV